MVEGEKSLTPAGNVKAASLTTVASWVLEAWWDLPDEMVTRSFKKCRISNSTDGTEDDMLWEEEEDSVPDKESEGEESEDEDDDDEEEEEEEEEEGAGEEVTGEEDETQSFKEKTEL